MLLTDSDGQVCYEERVEQSLSADKTVKNLTCLLFDVPTDLGLQLGRANAVCRRIHRMLKHGQRSIDDGKMEEVNSELHAKYLEFVGF